MLSCAHSRHHPHCTPGMSADASSAQPHAIDEIIERCLNGDQAAWEAIVRTVLAQGVQHRVQVRRHARPGGGSDAGRLPQAVQVARHVRSPRQLPDVADQRQPQPLHRSLPQRPQGARDDQPRRRPGGAVARSSTTRSPHARARAARPRASCCGRRSTSWRRRCAPRSCCATSRS